MHLVPMRCHELDPDQDIVVICHHGARSMQVAMFLERKGYGAIHNLMGGVEAWANEVDSNMRRY
jgi:rhodanese-related sulfurtransferase